jgi:serine/threonine protein kinase
MRVSGSFCARCGARVGPGAYFCPRCGTSIPVAPADAPTVATAPPPPHDAGRAALLDALRQAALGEYEILAELGRGGMATVYLAHDVALDRKVAIKVLAPALLQMGEGMVERFKREARTAAALSHPHIIPIYAVKESERVLYFVMKYVQGRPLDSVLRDVGALPITMVQAIIAQVGDALGYAHRHGVIHRDIKSANIMLDEEGWAVVTDFGIAKVVQAEGLTVTGVTVGTPTYMSPEQCETREVTGASDQYSLGIVAYEMLTGRLPFQADSTMAVMYAHFNERPRPVTELRPDCPANLAAAVMRMLAKDPAGRWPSMDDVIAVCGRPSLRHDDPVRGEMITLARAGGRSPALAQIKTPTSPLALSKSHTHPAPVAAPSRHGGPRLWWALGAGAGAVVVAAALWWTGPWRTATPRDTTAAAGPARAPAETSVAAAPPPPPALPATRTPAKRPPAHVTAPPAGAESAARAAAHEREDSLVRALRTTALGAMRRALEGGAMPTDLAKGETVMRAAESLAAAGRSAEAMVQLAMAASLWTEAERASRTRAAHDTVQERPAAPSTPPPVPHPPADPRAEIKALLADYARALESRDVNEVRRVYPGLTAVEQETFRQFFQSVPELKAALTINRLVVAGGSADAIVNGVYEYVDAKTGRGRRDTTTFRATLVQDSTGWHLSSIHSLR